MPEKISIKPFETMAPKKLVVNLKNLNKLPDFKTTYTLSVANKAEALEVLSSGVFFPAIEVKNAYYENKPLNP